jgi:hypothetical protein
MYPSADSSGSSGRRSEPAPRGEFALVRPQPHAARVAQHRVQPPTHGGGLAQLVDPAQRDEERVVHGVPGLRSVAQDPERQAVERRPVSLEEEPQARGIAPPGGLDELRVA